MPEASASEKTKLSKYTLLNFKNTAAVEWQLLRVTWSMFYQDVILLSIYVRTEKPSILKQVELSITFHFIGKFISLARCI